MTLMVAVVIGGGGGDCVGNDAQSMIARLKLMSQVTAAIGGGQG